MALVSILVFLVPLVTGLVGALMARQTPILQLLGGASGLLLGILFARLLVPTPAETDWQSE